MTSLKWPVDETDREKERRERIAIAAMQGLLAGGYFGHNTSALDVAAEAVDIADELISDLDRKRE